MKYVAVQVTTEPQSKTSSAVLQHFIHQSHSPITHLQQTLNRSFDGRCKKYEWIYSTVVLHKI